MDAQASVWSGFGASLAVSLASLGLVCLVAWVIVRGLARMAGREPGTRALRVRARLGLEPRRSLYVVQAGTRVFLVGASEGGMSLLAELAEGDVPTEAALPVPSGLLRWFKRGLTAGAAGRTDAPRPATVAPEHAAAAESASGSVHSVRLESAAADIDDASAIDPSRSEAHS